MRPAVVVIQLPALEEDHSGISAIRESGLLCSFNNIPFPLIREEKTEGKRETGDKSKDRPSSSCPQA